MKKFIFIYLFCIIGYICKAQDHMRFLGLPIEGTLTEFTNKLIKEKGFREKSMNKDEEYDSFISRKLIGKYEKFGECKIMVRQMDGHNNVSSVIVQCDTTKYNFQQAIKLINYYDSIYGAHKSKSLLILNHYQWKLDSGYIEILLSSFLIDIRFIDNVEVNARGIKPLDETEPLKSYQEYYEESVEKQTIKEICGIPFGTSYEKAKEILENKYGYSDYSPDKTTIIYSFKNYGGISFDKIIFLFQSDGYHSFLNGCAFVIDAKSLKGAQEMREMLYKKLSPKYTMVSNKDKNGNKYYIGGYSPIDKNDFGFSIEIIKYENYISENHRNTYATRLMYGRYNYIKEEF